MTEPTDAPQRFLALLQPIHDQARLTARRLCRSWADGDDVFQEAVLRALRRLSDLRDESRFRPWFFAVLLSVHRERARRPFWRRFLSLDRGPGRDAAEGPVGPDPEDLHGRAARMGHALSRLPAEQREAVVLFEVDGFSIEEIAEMQGVGASAVKSRLARGRARLRAHYQDLIASEGTALPTGAALAGKETT